jgi:glutamate racemase
MDSGMGGISVLRSLMGRMPGEFFIFWGDSKNAPYGPRDEADIRRLTWDVVEKLLARDVKAVVIACNTATSAAAADLRAKLDIPVLGLEPALKPAARCAGERRIAVLATEATIKLDKYHMLLERFGRNTVSIPCPELVEFVERGDTDSDALLEALKGRLNPEGEAIAAVVLGCTHYVWLRPAIRKVLPGAAVFDGNDGLARHLRDILGEGNLLNEGGTGGCELNTTSDDPAMLLLMKRYLAAPISE